MPMLEHGCKTALLLAQSSAVRYRRIVERFMHTSIVVVAIPIFMHVQTHVYILGNGSIYVYIHQSPILIRQWVFHGIYRFLQTVVRIVTDTYIYFSYIFTSDTKVKSKHEFKVYQSKKGKYMTWSLLCTSRIFHVASKKRKANIHNRFMLYTCMAWKERTIKHKAWKGEEDDRKIKQDIEFCRI